MAVNTRSGAFPSWEPGKRLLFAWRQSSFTAEQSTEVEVTFEAVGEETRVSIEHRAWDTIPATSCRASRLPRTHDPAAGGRLVARLAQLTCWPPVGNL